MGTGANELQHPIPEFLTGRIHSQPNLQRQESTHDTTMDTTLPLAEPFPAEQPQDPINRLADVLVSQAAACDGILYQVGPEDDDTNPGPGVLPI